MTAPGRAAEDYLEALLLLERELGEAHGAELARRMGVSKASVSVAMKQLRQNGYITVDKGHRLCLTSASMNAIAFLLSCSSAQAAASPPRSGTPVGWSTPSARRVFPGLKNSWMPGGQRNISLSFATIMGRAAVCHGRGQTRLGSRGSWNTPEWTA